MKKTKQLSLLLSGALAFGLLAGCGGGTASTPAPSESGTPSTDSSGEAFELTVNYFFEV